MRQVLSIQPSFETWRQSKRVEIITNNCCHLIAAHLACNDNLVYLLISMSRNLYIYPFGSGEDILLILMGIQNFGVIVSESKLGRIAIKPLTGFTDGIKSLMPRYSRNSKFIGSPRFPWSHQLQ